MAETSVFPVNAARHAATKIRSVDSFKFADNLNIISVLVNEFTRAAAYYPIVFVSDKGKYSPCLLTGIQQGENLYVDSTGKWEVPYIPAMIRRNPFMLGKSQNENAFMLCIDEKSPFVSDTEGRPLFDEQGAPTKLVEDAKNYLAGVNRYVEATRQFSERLADYNLLSHISVKVSVEQGNDRNIEGFYSVNEKKLNELPDPVFLELRKSGDLQLIYAHLLSMVQTEKLAQLKTKRN